jgi:DNA polymerase III sliding clamp (beta) subunit (PCNA family)
VSSKAYGAPHSHQRAAEAREGKLALTATDLDTTFHSEIDVTAIATGAVTAPARRLYDVVRDIPGPP